jgi:hypothetical protein
MKARDHTKIMKQSLAAARARNQESLERTRRFYEQEIIDRQNVIDNFCAALDRMDWEVAALTKLLGEHGIDAEALEEYLSEERAKEQ